MCAHIACFCSVPIGEEFCSDTCREAGSDGVEVACHCNHSACPVTAPQFVASLPLEEAVDDERSAPVCRSGHHAGDAALPQEV